MYLWDRTLNNQNVISSWTSEIKNIFYACGLSDIFENGTMFPLKSTIEEIKEKFKTDQANYLKTECMQQRKLRTFNKFKLFGNTPAYVTKPMSFYQRKLFAKLRLGSLELRIETEDMRDLALKLTREFVYFVRKIKEKTTRNLKLKMKHTFYFTAIN